MLLLKNLSSLFLLLMRPWGRQWFFVWVKHNIICLNTILVYSLTLCLPFACNVLFQYILQFPFNPLLLIFKLNAKLKANKQSVRSFLSNNFQTQIKSKEFFGEVFLYGEVIFLVEYQLPLFLNDFVCTL